MKGLTKNNNNYKIKKGSWVLCPLTKDDIYNPTIVAKVVDIDNLDIVTIQLSKGTVLMPKNYCRVVFVQEKQ